MQLSHSEVASSPEESLNVSFAHNLPASPSPPPQRVVRQGAASLDAFRAGAQQSVREFEAHLHELQTMMQRAEEDQARPRTPPQYRDERSAAEPRPQQPPPRRRSVVVDDDPSDDDADLSVELNPDSAGHEAMQRVKEIERARAERKRRSLHAQRVEDERRWQELDLSDASAAPPPRKPVAATAHHPGSRPHTRAPAQPQPQRRRSISPPPSFFERLGSVERPAVFAHFLSQSTPLPKRGGGAASAGNPLNSPTWKRLHDVAADQGWDLRSEPQHPVDASTARASQHPPRPQPALTQWPFLSAKPVRISYEQAARQQSQSSAQPRRSIYAAVGRAHSRSPHRADHARDENESKEEFRPSALLSPSASELFAMQLEAMDAAQKQSALRERQQAERLQEQQRRSVAQIVRSPERLRSTQRVQPASPPPPPPSRPAAAAQHPQSKSQPNSQPAARPLTPSSPLSSSSSEQPPSPPSSPPTPPRRVRAVDHMRRTPRIEPPVVLRSPIRVLPPPPVPAAADSTLGELEFAPLPSFASTSALSSAAHSPSLSPVRARTASPIRAAPVREASPLRAAAYSSSPPRVAAGPTQRMSPPPRASMAPSSPQQRFERPHPSSSLAYTPPLSSSLAFTPPQQAAPLDSPARSLQVTLSSVRMESSELDHDDGDGVDADEGRSDSWSLASESPRHAPAVQPSPPTSPLPVQQLRPPAASPSSLAFDASFDASMRASFGASFGAARSGSASASVSVLFGSPARGAPFSPESSSGRRAPRPSPEAARVERRLMRYSLLLPATSSPRTR